jgi:hypothetical protein
VEGTPCKAVATTFSQIECITGAASGAASATFAGTCSIAYDTSGKPTLTDATVTASNDTLWHISLSGTDFAVPVSDNTVWVGSEACTPIEGSDTTLSCTMAPPRAGMQHVRLFHAWVEALAALPVELAVSSMSPQVVSIVGGEI